MRVPQKGSRPLFPSPLSGSFLHEGDVVLGQAVQLIDKTVDLMLQRRRVRRRILLFCRNDLVCKSDETLLFARRNAFYRNLRQGDLKKLQHLPFTLAPMVKPLEVEFAVQNRKQVPEIIRR